MNLPAATDECAPGAPGAPGVGAGVGAGGAAGAASDFVALDAGRLSVREDYVEAFERYGWSSAARVIALPYDVALRDLGHRAIGTLSIARGEGESPTRVFLKRHRGERNVAPGSPGSPDRPGRPASAGVAEAQAFLACRRLGVPALPVIAFGQTAADERGHVDSFTMSEALEGWLPADDYWSQATADDAESHEASSGASAVDASASDASPGDRFSRGELLVAMADIAARLHNAGYFHRDFYWCHFMVSPHAGGGPAVRLIDLQRLRGSHPAWRWYARLKDLAQFYLSRPPAPTGPSDEEMRRWFAIYRQGDSGISADTAESRVRLSFADRLRFAFVRCRAALYELKGVKR